MPVRIFFRVLLAAAAGSLLPACGGAPTETPVDPVVVSQVTNVAGVPDRGLDPSVVSVTNPRGEICSGVLLASTVVLTARHCVTEEPQLVDCDALNIFPPPNANPATLQVSAQAPGSSGPSVSTGVAVLTSADTEICGADLAVVILASAIEGIVPALVGESGIAEGGHVRTVGLALAAAEGGETEIVREHVPVVSVSASELAVGEETCVASGGSAAYDETTGAVVGILSRWGSACGAGAQFDIFTRADVFYGLVQEGLAWQPTVPVTTLDGGATAIVDAGRKHDAGHAKKPPTDLGAACFSGADCGTGLCVTAEGSQYCSRTCAPADNCPTDFKCVIAQGGASVCVQS
jgi:hypothetical protein